MPTFWSDLVLADPVATNTKLRLDVLERMTTIPSRFDRMTLTRVIIGLDVGVFTHDSGEGSETVFMGLGVLGRDAFALSGAAIPDPSVSGDYPGRGWVWRAGYRVYGFAADQPAVFNQRVDLDLRAQRKLENGVLTFVVKNTPGEGVATTILVNGVIRCLWLI